LIATVSSLYVAAITYDVCVLDVLGGHLIVTTVSSLYVIAITYDVCVLTDVKADVIMYRSCRRMNVYFPGLTQIEARKQPEKT
jgi:hypothetical protein